MQEPIEQPASPHATPASPQRAAASKKRLAALETPNESSSPSDPDPHTAIYDISSRMVYLPNGRRLEAHSGFGSYMDDVRYVSAKARGPTPPNVYVLSMREQLFHGVRAIRLTPVGDGNMFGRAGILAHPYMLGPNGQSNGCVSFSDYPAARKQRPATVFTIHNLAYQGLFPSDILASLPLPDGIFTPEGIAFYGKLSFLNAGIRFGDHITTVSPSYAREILGSDFGCGLDGLLRHRKKSIT